MSKKYTFTFEETVEALKRGGLKEGDTVWVFSSLGFLGRPEGVRTPEEVCRFFHHAIRKAIGEGGTIIVPTYSYTIGRNTASEPAVFDPKEEPAKIGPFPDYFRKLPGVVRSLDPMMPIAGEGPKAEKLLREVPPNSYGHDSVYERLLFEENVKILTLGLGPNWIPFIHYLDWLHKVPFRYDKHFTGAVKKREKNEYLNWIYPVRTLIEESYPWAYRAGELAKEKGICKYTQLGKGGFYICNYRRYLVEVYRVMEKDKWFLAKGPAVDVYQKELERLREKPFKVKLPVYDPKKWLEVITPLRRDLISLSTDAVLEGIKEHFGEFEIKEVPTGEYCLSWIVPERWSLYRAKLINAETGEVVVDAEENPASVYSYSKPFKGEVDKNRLLKHIATCKYLPDARPIVNVVSDRDWGFSLTKEELNRLTADRYLVEIESDYSFAKLRWLETFVEGSEKGEILLVAFIDGPYRANEHLSGLIALLELLKEARERKPKKGLRFLITVSEVGLPCWIEKNKKGLENVDAILVLTSLGNGDIYTLQVNGVKNPLIGKLSETLKMLNEPYVLLTEGLYNPLPFGGNPFVYYPKKEKILRNIERLERNFSIKGRIDFLRNPFEIFELGIPEKVVVLGKTLPPNTLYFPFKGRGTDLDDIKAIDWKALNGSINLLKILLF